MTPAIRPLAWLASPWANVAALVLGGVAGTRWPAVGTALGPFGDLFLALMQMCVLPIIITAVTVSVARLLRPGQSAAILRQLVLIFLGGLTISAAVALIAGLLVEPGSGLAQHERVFMAQEMLRREAGGGPDTPPSLWLLAEMIVPANIVRAAAEGKTLALMLFSILLGLGLGALHTRQGEQAIDTMDAFYNALVKVMGWILFGLPLGLFALMASHAAHGSPEMFLALGRLVATLYGLGLLLIAAMTMLTALRTRLSPLAVLARLRQPLLVAFGTCSSIASLPAALRAVEDGLGVERRTAQMVLPLGVSLHPVGNVLHVVVSCVFVLQLYGLPVSLNAGILVTVGGILVACAMTGAPGIASMALLGMLLAPFGVPVEVAIMLLVALEPVLDPLLTLLNVYGNVTAAALAEAQPQRKELAGTAPTLGA